MNRITDYEELKNRITTWIGDYIVQNPSIKALVVGASGGIDSSVVSTLCAETGLRTYVVSMPLNQISSQADLSDYHREFLAEKYSNVIPLKIDLSSTFNQFLTASGFWLGEEMVSNKLALANTRSRLRMVTLYQIAGSVGGIVAGTGNKVEDYGVGFYTKYGDGGVDIAPIADLYKTEVWELGKYLGVDQRIIDAQPTDGLWDDGRTDEDQIGSSYELLEWVMESGIADTTIIDPETATTWMGKELTEEQRHAIKQYKKFNTQNKHKMESIPTFKL
jgi:NAD+ synthase